MAGFFSATWQLEVSRMGPSPGTPSGASSSPSCPQTCRVLLLPPTCPALTLTLLHHRLRGSSHGGSRCLVVLVCGRRASRLLQPAGSGEDSEVGSRRVTWKPPQGLRAYPFPCRLTSCSVLSTTSTLTVWTVKSLRPLSP